MPARHIYSSALCLACLSMTDEKQVRAFHLKYIISLFNGCVVDTHFYETYSELPWISRGQEKSNI